MMERDQIGCVHWTSERFNSTGEEEYPTNFVFFDDKKARPVSHNGLEGFVVGRASPITENEPEQLLVLFGETVTTLHPSRVIYERSHQSSE